MLWRSIRAIWLGVTVDLAGSLAATIFVGLVAVTALVLRGDSAERIVVALSNSAALTVFAALGGILMSIAGGYAAATSAGRAYLQHALTAGVLALAINSVILLSGHNLALDGFNLAILSCTLPCSALGGWLAMPISVRSASPS